MNLLISFRSELLKTRRTAAFYFTLIAAAVLPCLSILAVALDGLELDPGEDPLSGMLEQRFSFLIGALFPIFIILICTLLAQVEYKNNTWKQVFTSPQPRLSIFVARFLNVHVMIVLFLLMYNIFLLISMVATHFMYPAAHLLDKPQGWQELVTWNARAYVSVLALSAIQFWLSLRFRNFIIPMGIGLALWIISTVTALEYKLPNAYFFPYTYSAYSCFPAKFKDLMPAVQLGSFVYMIIFLVVGFMDFRRGKR